MRKTFNFTLTAMIMAFVFTMSSCNSEEMISEKQNAYLPEYTNQTLQDLEKFNQTFEASKETVQTRSGIWRFFRRLGRTVCADVVGAGKSVKDGSVTAQDGSLWVNLLKVISGAWNSSKEAYKNEGTELAPDEDDLFENYKTYCRTNVDIVDPDTIQSQDILVTYNNYSVNISEDTLYNQIQLPSSMVSLKQIGIAHNDILEQCYLNVIDSNGLGNGLQWDDPKPEEPDYGENEYLDNEEFEYDYYSTIEKIDSCCGTTGFNYQTYLSLYPFESQNVHQTEYLLLDALQNTVTSMADVINLVNGYITIIETNNDFTFEEKAQIYTSLTVAVYSYSLWSNRITDIIH